MMMPEFLATGNDNKLREFNQILGRDLQKIAVDLTEVQAVEVEEVIKGKAVEAYELTGKVVLVEDTGLAFEVWNGLPGALVKWFLDRVGNEGILKMLEGEENRRAVAKTVVGFYDGEEVRVFSGEVRGTIAESAKEGGFGWDGIFVPDGFDKTFAEMSAEEKNEVSMRRRAIDALRMGL